MSNDIWTALQREAAFVSEQMCLSVNLVSDSNYARQGCYLQLFFSLSLAFERAAKLIIIVNEMLEKGQKPDENTYKKYGHDINEMFQGIEHITEQLNLKESVLKPDSQVHNDIITITSNFGKNITRYYNFDVIGKNKNMPNEPISEWHTRITLPLFEKHVSKKKKSIIYNNSVFNSVFSDSIYFARFFDETGNLIDTLQKATYQMGLILATQPYVRLYILQICRYIGSILTELGYWAMKKGVNEIPYFANFFRPFNNKDIYLKRRKRWAIS
jgi:hypothetical protein